MSNNPYILYEKTIEALKEEKIYLHQIEYIDKSDLENRLTDLLTIKPDNNNDLSTITEYEGNF